MPARAQIWRTIDASRQLRDTAPISAHIDYAAGKLELRPAAGALLYHASVRYDATRTEPFTRFDTLSRILSLGVHLRDLHIENGEKESDAGSMHAELSPRVPVDLTVDLGAVEADMQLGGLRVADLTLHCGAADVTSHFDQPNRATLRQITLQVGAAQVKMMDLANAGVSRINAEIGAGSLTLDLTGALAHDVDVTASLALGGITVNVAPDDGVFVDESSLLGGFDKDGFVKRADGWYSANYDAAARHVRVRLRAFLGGLKIVRTGS
jgi:hypothetical protein